MSFTVTAPISIFPSTKLDGTPSRRLVVSVPRDMLATLPEELFAVKISQSRKPDRAGRLMFSYLSYKLNGAWSTFAPEKFTVASPLSDIKNTIVASFATMDVEVQFSFNMPGKFANIDTPQGRYTIFDFNQFPEGSPGYYLKGDTKATVTFTPATHNGNAYLRIALSTEFDPSEIFVKGGRGKIFGAEEEEANTGAVFTPQDDVDDVADLPESGGVIWP